MKQYKIFISFSTPQVDLPKKIKTILEELFDYKINFYFSEEHILGGEEWRKSIQNGLKDCDAILCMLTPKFLASPWVYIEWSAFWLAEKKRFMILTDDVEAKDITEIIRDTQSTNIFIENDVIKLFQGIAEDMGVELPKNLIEPAAIKLANTAKVIYRKILDNQDREKNAMYKDDLSLLPDDDFEKKDILKYFYKIGEDDTVLEIFKKIKDNAISNNILHFLLSKEEFGLVDKLVDNIIDRDVQLSLLKGLFDKGLENSSSAEKILENISTDSPKLRSLAEYLLAKDKLDTEVFYQIVSNISNFAELRKLAVIMANSNVYDNRVFKNIINKFLSPTGNATEFRKLLEHLFKNTDYPKIDVEKHITELSNKNQSVVGNLLESLIETDKSFVQKMLDLGVIRNNEVKERVMGRMNY